MSAPKRDILNDRETSSPRSARLRPQLHIETNPAQGPGPSSAARSPFQPEPVSAGFHPDGSRAPRPLPASRSRRRGFRDLLPGNLAARFGGRERSMDIDDDEDGGGGRRGCGQIHGSQFHRPQAHGSQAHGPQRGGSAKYGPQTRSPQNCGPQGNGHQDYGAQIYGSPQLGSQAYGPQGRGLRAQATQDYGPQAHGPRVDDRQRYLSAQAHGPRNHGTQEHARQAQGRQGYGPQGFSSQFYNPQPGSWIDDYNTQPSSPQIHYEQRTQTPPHFSNPFTSYLAKRQRREAAVYHPSLPIRSQNHHPPFRPFPGIFNALLNHPELIINLGSHLPLPTLVSLYAISRPFHHTVNQRFTALMRANADLHAPESRIAFPHHCYPHLCRPDPAARINELYPAEVRATPTLRWLAMVLFRERVVDEILALLQKEGLNMPSLMSSTIKKIWFVMDISVNALRLGILRNTEIWSNEDLYRATEFMLKLAMRFTDPNSGSGSLALRNLVMAQKSLSTLWRVLKREELRSQLEVLRMEVRTFYIPPRHAHLPILGVPPKKIGRLQYETYGRDPDSDTKLLALHELIMKEGIRRELALQGWYLDMALSGFVDKSKGMEWRDVWGQEEVQVEDVEVNSQGEETGSETEWESEEEYFMEESTEDEGEGTGSEGGSGEEEDEEMVDAVADDEGVRWRGEREVRRRRGKGRERHGDGNDGEGARVKKEDFRGLPGNFAFAFDDNDPDLQEARDRHRAYLASLQQGRPAR